MFCKHDWKVLSETTTESKLSHIINVLEKNALRTFRYTPSDVERKHIVIVSCSKCGKLKRFVEEI